jgi:UDP-glucose 4-epimerase
VFASSSAVYGDAPAGPNLETGPTEPRSPYAVGKLASERLLASAHALYGVETVSLRYFNVYGPDQDLDGDYAAVVPRFVEAALAGVAATLHGDGEQTRDFCFVEDVVDANLAAARADTESGRAYNVGTGRSVSVAELHAAIARAVAGRTGRASVPPHRGPPRPGDVRHSICDASAAARGLGWRATTTLDDGIRTTVAFAADQRSRTT